MRIIRTPPAFTVYFTTFICRRKKPSSLAVKIPAARNGRMNPIVYTPISRNPFTLVWALPAMSRTLASAGPTQGVQAKLKVKPRISAVTGDMVIFSRRSGSRCSSPRTLDVPKTPS